MNILGRAPVRRGQDESFLSAAWALVQCCRFSQIPSSPNLITALPTVSPLPLSVWMNFYLGKSKEGVMLIVQRGITADGAPLPAQTQGDLGQMEGWGSRWILTVTFIAAFSPSLLMLWWQLWENQTQGKWWSERELSFGLQKNLTNIQIYFYYKGRYKHGINKLILFPYLNIKLHLYVACVFLYQWLTSVKYKVLECCSGLCNSGRF